MDIQLIWLQLGYSLFVGWLELRSCGQRDRQVRNDSGTSFCMWTFPL